jgi:hypothetical protein
VHPLVVLVNDLASAFGDALRWTNAPVLAALHVDAQVSVRFALQLASAVAEVRPITGGIKAASNATKNLQGKLVHHLPTDANDTLLIRAVEVML